jgi:hypothetical protein
VLTKRETPCRSSVLSKDTSGPGRKSLSQKEAKLFFFFYGVKSFLMQGNSYKGQEFAFVHFEGLGERHAACSMS